jgi:lysophospholipase L1-like esterase
MNIKGENSVVISRLLALGMVAAAVGGGGLALAPRSAFAATARENAQTATAWLADAKKIVAVSDSLTNDRPDNWLALLGTKLPKAMMVANAYGGWTTETFFKERFKDVAFAKIPRDAGLFIILLGSNNLFEDAGGSDASVNEATNGVQRLAKHLLSLSPGARIMLVAPPTVALKNNHLPDPKPARRIDAQTPEYLSKLSKSYRTLAARQGWFFADLFPVLDQRDFVDAAHPGKAGNRKIADTIWRALVNSPAPPAKESASTSSGHPLR